MIIPSHPPSPDHDQDPPSYQESQRLPSERRSSLYAPPVSYRSSPPREREREWEPDVDEPTETTSLVPPPPPPKGREKAKEKDDPSQVWDAKPTASTSSRSPDPASTSYISPAQDPLNPAPDAFTRPTAKGYEYSPFQPMTMLGISSNLADGFPMIPPPINPEDDRSARKGPDPQHPFVSHDVTEDDWLKFLAGLKTSASTPNQTQRSFLTRVFLGEMNEKDQRKRTIHFVNSWNHYFFQPRRMTVALAHGQKIFEASDHHQRRHSISAGQGRDTEQTRDHRRSRSSDSSSSRHSAPSVRSTASEPPEMPASHTHEPSLGKVLTKGHPNKSERWTTDVGSAVSGGLSDIQHGVFSGLNGVRDGIYDGLYHLQYGVNLGLRNLHGGLNEGFYHVNSGLQSALGGPGPRAVPQTAGPGGGEPSQSPTDRDSKEAWKAQLDQRKVQQDEWKRQQDARKQEQKAEQKALKSQERGMKPERKLTKEASKKDEEQRKLEGKGKSRDQSWKLIIFFHGARGETEHS